MPRAQLEQLTAIHEAAHAVACVVFRIAFKWVSVVSDGSVLGRTVLDVRPPAPWRTAHGRLRYLGELIKSELAGVAAEYDFCERHRWSTVALSLYAQQDIDSAQRRIDAARRVRIAIPNLDVYQLRASRFVVAHRGRIEAVADELIMRDTLSAAEVRGLVNVPKRAAR